MTGNANQLVAYGEDGEEVLAIPIDGYHFTSWDDGSTENPRKDTNVSGNIRVEAQYAISYYVVKYVNWDGEELIKETVTYGVSVDPPMDPSREGHSFKGWDADSGYVISDMTINPIYEPFKYNVTFEAKGGSEVASQEVLWGNKIDKPEDPERAGYDFVDWYKDSDLDSPWDFNKDLVKSDVTLYGKWTYSTDTEYTVHHYYEKLDGGYELIEQVLTGTTYSLVTAEKDEKEGFEEDGNHSDRVNAGNIQPDGSLVLKLYYNRKKYDVKFKGLKKEDGTENVFKTVEVKHGASVGEDSLLDINTSADGYEFLGWYGDYTNITKNKEIYGFYVEKENGKYVFRKDYTDNSKTSYSIGDISIVAGKVLENFSPYTFTYYSNHGGTVIDSVSLPNGGTTLMGYVEATGDGYADFQGDVIFKYGSVTVGNNEIYYTIEDALKKATSGTVYVKYNTSFADEDIAQEVYVNTDDNSYYEVKSGVTLLLPYSNAFSSKLDDTPGNDGGKTITKNSAYVELVVPSNTTLEVKGTLTVNAQRGSSSTKHMGHIHQDNYSQLHLSDSSKIEVKSGGKLNSIGFIYGGGTIEAEPGSEVREPLFIKGFRGGSATKEIQDDVFPFDQFTINNIESDLRVNQGAKYIGAAMIYVKPPLSSSQYFHGDLVIIYDDKSLLKLTSGSIIKKYDSSNGNVTLELNGVAALNDSSISVSQISVDSKGKDMPFDGTWHFIVSSGSNLEINTYAALLPGATMTIKEGATVTIKSGKRLTIFDPYEHIDEYNTYPDKTVKNYRVDPTISFNSDTPAALTVLGTLAIEGNLAGRLIGNYSSGASISPYEVNYVIGSAGSAEAISREVSLWGPNDITISVTKNKQSHVIGDTDDILLEALVKNSNNEPLSGVDVDFSIIKGKGSFATVSYTTGANGRAVAKYTTSSAEDEGELILKATATSEGISANAIIEVKKKAGGGFSCPFVYSFDGKEYHFEHESIPFAVNKALETTSFGTLRRLEAHNDFYHVRIGERLDEKSFVNNFKLSAVDYPTGEGIIEVFADIYGQPHTIKEKRAPITIVDSYGLDRLDDILLKDKILSSSREDLANGNYVTSYDVTFEKPTDTAEYAKLMVTAQKTYLITQSWDWLLETIDATNNMWWIERVMELPENIDKFKNFINMVNLRVELWDGERWVEQGHVKAGLDLVEEFLIPIDLSNLKTDENELKVRLTSGTALYDIWDISIDFSKDDIVNIIDLDPEYAWFNSTEDVKGIIGDYSNDERVKLVTGDDIDLYYKIPELKDNLERGFMVALKGYYHADPDSKEFPVGLDWDGLNTDGIIQQLFLMEDLKALEILPGFAWMNELIESLVESTLEEKIKTTIVNNVLPWINSK